MFKRLISLLLVCLCLPLSAGPLAEKASSFDRLIQQNHCPEGLVFDVHLDDQGKFSRIRGGGDSLIWSGAYAASQVYRYRVTKDPDALRNLEKNLWAFHHLQAMSGSPGFVGRSFVDPTWIDHIGNRLPGVGTYSNRLFQPSSSRDQYTGLFLAYALAWPLIQDPVLKATVREDVRAIGRSLVENRLAMIGRFSTGVERAFNIDPCYIYQDRLTREEWEKVDDFPANILAKLVPYDEEVAAILATIKPPPVRGGEALRALLMLGTAARISEDPTIASFYNDEMLKRRDFVRIASETSQLLTDLYLGRGHDVFIRIWEDLAMEMSRITAMLVLHRQKAFLAIVRVFKPAFEPLIRSLARSEARMIIRFIDACRRPEAFAVLEKIAVPVESIGSLVLMCGAVREAQKLAEFGSWLREASRSNLDEWTDAQRSYVGTNITFFALLGLLESDPEPSHQEAYRDITWRGFVPIADEGNSLYTFIRAGYVPEPLAPDILASAVQTLRDYPVDQVVKPFDHRFEIGVRLLPWPDRFGRMYNQADRVFPMHQRCPHIFPWQEPPRKVVYSSDDKATIAPVGYLLAYWLGRDRGFLKPED